MMNPDDRASPELAGLMNSMPPSGCNINSMVPNRGRTSDTLDTSMLESSVMEERDTGSPEIPMSGGSSVANPLLARSKSPEIPMQCERDTASPEIPMLHEASNHSSHSGHSQRKQWKDRPCYKEPPAITDTNPEQCNSDNHPQTLTRGLNNERKSGRTSRLSTSLSNWINNKETSQSGTGGSSMTTPSLLSPKSLETPPPMMSIPLLQSTDAPGTSSSDRNLSRQAAKRPRYS